MKLTPLDIRHKEFKRGMRGYMDAEVDEFLDEVADEFERVFKENIELSDRLEALQEQITHYRMIEETLQKTLLSAQQSAEEVRVNAEKEAELIVRDAELKARATVGEAYDTKQAIEKETVLLRNAEGDFRFKFRALLEGYLKQLAGEDRPARQKAGEFAKQAQVLKDAIENGRPVAEPPQPPAAAEADTPSIAVPEYVHPSAPPGLPEEPATEEPAAAVPAEPPTEEVPSPAGAGDALIAPSLGPEPAVEPASAAADEGEDTAALTGAQQPAAAAIPAWAQPTSPQPAAPQTTRPPIAKDDDFLADVDDGLGDNEFKW
jgi:cell division initiation protein